LKRTAVKKAIMEKEEVGVSLPREGSKGSKEKTEKPSA